MQHLAELEPLRRYATLTALVLELKATLTDEALKMFEHLVGQLFKKSERTHAEQFHASGKSINEKVRLLRPGRPSAHPGAFQREAMYLPLSRPCCHGPSLNRPWLKRRHSLSRKHLTFLLCSTIATVACVSSRRLLLAHFEFHAAPAAAELLQALDLLRDLNASGKRTLPEHVPTGFVKPRWRPYVFPSSGVDRHFYELCGTRGTA